MMPSHSAASAANLLTREVSTRSQIRTSLFLAALLLPFSSWLLYMTVTREDLTFPSEPWVIIAVGGAFWLVGLLALLSALLQLIARRIAEPEVSIDCLPLQAGRKARLHVRLPGPARLNSLSARLTCEIKTRREWRSQTDGMTKHSYDSQYPCELDIPVVGTMTVARGEVLDRAASFVVPTVAESTRERDDRSVIWRIEIRVEVAGWPDSLHAYRVTVQGRDPLRLLTDPDDDSDEVEQNAEERHDALPGRIKASGLVTRVKDDWSRPLLGGGAVLLLAVLWVYGRPFLLNVFDKQPADQSAPSVAASGGVEPEASSDDDRSFAAAEEAFARQDYAMAIAMFTKLAEKGWASAQSYLGEMYAEGFGTRQDFAQAAIWYERAAAQGHAIAENNLGVLYDHGTGVTRDYGKAVVLFRSAAEQGMRPAKCNLAEMYAGGKGIAKDLKEARRLAKEVSDSGGEPCLELQEKYGIGLPTQGR